VGHKVQEVAQLILADGLDEHRARELAMRIVDFERNLDHERETFASVFTNHSAVTDKAVKETKETRETKQAKKAQKAEKAGMGREWQMLTDELSVPGTEEINLEGIKLLRQVQRFVNGANRRSVRKEALTYERYYRRATNQLIKSLKAI
jgi:hypothetical protein